MIAEYEKLIEKYPALKTARRQTKLGKRNRACRVFVFQFFLTDTTFLRYRVVLLYHSIDR